MHAEIGGGSAPGHGPLQVLKQVGARGGSVHILRSPTHGALYAFEHLFPFLVEGGDGSLPAGCSWAGTRRGGSLFGWSGMRMARFAALGNHMPPWMAYRSDARLF
jgi:hypothetical protein